MVMTTEEKIQTLKNKLKECDTEDILGNISLTYITHADADGFIDRKTRFMDSELMSPQKQRLYLAGLLMSTGYNGKSPAYDENRSKYKALEDDIQSITSDYIKGFLDFDTESFDPKNEALREELKKRHVSMEAFISYFDTGIYVMKNKR